MSNMVVQTNVLALNSHRYMKQVGNAQSKSSARLSSGYKINSAADDAAGLAISEKMRAQIRGLDQASKNAQDGISLIQTAEGGMQEIDNMLQRIRELVVSVSNDTNENNEVGTGDRQKMQDEIDQLVAEIDSMSERVEFNKKKVINGSYADTALQLRNAKAEYDRSSLAKVETNAKLSAYKEALGATDDQSSATGTTAYSRLNYAQDNVDAEVPTYTAALKAYTAAEVTYTEAQSAYQTARQTMEDQLSKANKSASEITDAMLDKSNAVANFGKDFDFDSFARAFTAYQEASNTWGVEELGFVDKTTGLSNILDTNVLTKTAFTGFASADAALAAAKGAQATYDAALAAALEDTDAADYLTADPDATTKTAFDTAAKALADAGVDATFLSTKMPSDLTSEQLTALNAYITAADDYGVDPLNIKASNLAAVETYPANMMVTVDTTAASGTNAAKYAAMTLENVATTGSDAATIAAVADFLTEDVDGSLMKAYYDAVKDLQDAIDVFSSTDMSSLSGAASTDMNALVDAVDAYYKAANDWGLNDVNGTAFASLMVGNDSGTGTAIATVLTSIEGLTGGKTVSETLTATTTAADAAAKFAAVAALATVGTDAGATSAQKNIKAIVTAGGTTFCSAYEAYSDAVTAVTTSAASVISTGKFTAATTNSVINALSTTAKADIAAYAAAANTWGADGMELQKVAEYGEIALATVPDVDNTATDNAALYNALGTDSAKLVDDVAAAKVALDKLGEYGKFQIEKETFTAAEAKYTDLVAKRDTAQATVNTLTNSVESTEKEKTRTDMLYNVANAKLDTAKNAVEADDSQALYFQVGANAMQGLEMSIGSVKSDVLGIGDGKGVTNIDVVKDTGLDTTALLDVLDTALSYVTTERSRLGAAQNRLEYTIKSLDISSENLSAAESRIRDTDMAKEMMELTKANTLQQASISMLAQANQAPQSVLQLLG